MPFQRTFRTPLEGDLELLEISNSKGLRMRFFPNGALFAAEHEDGRSRIMLNQMLGSPLGFCITRVLLRTGGSNPFNGTLDEVRLYDVVLSPADILTLAAK